MVAGALLTLSSCSSGGADFANQRAPATTVTRGAAEAPADAVNVTRTVRYPEDSVVADQALGILDPAALSSPSEILTVQAAELGGTGPLVPAGSVVEVQSETWERRGRIAAVVVSVTLPGSDKSDEFVAWLVDTGDGWRLSHTELTGTDG